MRHLSLLAAALLASSGCPKTPPTATKAATTKAAATPLPTTIRLRGEAFASEWAVNIVVVNERQRLAAPTLAPSIDAAVAEVARQVSAWDPQSEVRRFSDARHRNPLKASRSTVRIVAVALDVAARSDGAFDPTIGPLLDLWGFSSTTKGTVTSPPSAAAMALAKTHVGYKHISLAGEMLHKDDADVTLDVTALGDGAAAAAIAAFLVERGFSDFLIDVAGEVVVSGRGERDGARRDWRVGINTPSSDAAATDSERLAVLAPAAGALRACQRSEPISTTLRADCEASRHGAFRALSTSGTYREAWSSNGTRFSHIIDPTTGAPVTHDLVSCTIVGADVIVADALSTACVVLGEERTRTMLLEQPGYEALFIRAPTADTFVTTTTASFPPSP